MITETTEYVVTSFAVVLTIAHTQPINSNTNDLLVIKIDFLARKLEHMLRAIAMML